MKVGDLVEFDKKWVRMGKGVGIILSSHFRGSEVKVHWLSMGDVTRVRKSDLRPVKKCP